MAQCFVQQVQVGDSPRMSYLPILTKSLAELSIKSAGDPSHTACQTMMIETYLGRKASLMHCPRRFGRTTGLIVLAQLHRKLTDEVPVIVVPTSIRRNVLVHKLPRDAGIEVVVAKDGLEKHMAEFANAFYFWDDFDCYGTSVPLFWKNMHRCFGVGIGGVSFGRPAEEDVEAGEKVLVAAN